MYLFNFSDTTLELSVMPKDEDILQVVSFIYSNMWNCFIVMNVKNSLKMEVQYKVFLKDSREKNSNALFFSTFYQKNRKRGERDYCPFFTIKQHENILLIPQ